MSKSQPRFPLAFAVLAVLCLGVSGGAFGQCFYVSLPTWTSYYTSDQYSDLVGMCEVQHCSESCWGDVTPYALYSPQSIDCLPPGCSECWPPNCPAGMMGSRVHDDPDWLLAETAPRATPAGAACPQGEKAAGIVSVRR